MKKVITLIVLFLISIAALSQYQYVKIHKPNTIYFVYEPVYNGMGIRYDRMFNQYWGSYIALTYGNYKFDTGEGIATIDDHFKVVSGILIYLTPELRDYRTSLGLGLSYNSYGEQYNVPTDMPQSALNPWSFELSCNARIATRFNIGVRLDVIKWESAIDVGFSF